MLEIGTITPVTMGALSKFKTRLAPIVNEISENEPIIRQCYEEIKPELDRFSLFCEANEFLKPLMGKKKASRLLKGLIDISTNNILATLEKQGDDLKEAVQRISQTSQGKALRQAFEDMKRNPELNAFFDGVRKLFA